MNKRIVTIIVTLVITSAFITGFCEENLSKVNGMQESSNNLVSPTSHESKSFDVNNKKIKAEVITIDLKNSKIELKTALANGTIGAVDTIENIANSNGAVAAINGTYFGAYTEDKDPYGVLVVQGKILHTGSHRSVFGFDKDNNVDIDILMPRIRGYNGEPKWKYSWNGYWLNHTPIKGGESVIVYTPERGKKVRSDLGTNVIVKDGKITEITEGNVDIPENGLVINLYGSIKDQIFDRFEVGRSVEYNVDLYPKHKNDEFWKKVDGAVGAGPGLVWDGKVTLNLEEERFSEAKITSIAAARSAIGFTKDKKLILLTTRRATINDLAEMMVKLGCEKAMNLDGGASSGLYYNGKVITKPGRQISNAILIIEEEQNKELKEK
ncbi:phosphodiester glycosidase family protein [Wukongibacter baidiensis]|uniref:phosphodiester glycosidase family protein n=1 Tax=Wukongibacter baidiensis TaxID=1723361 RepID=UPI003D7F395D